MDSKTVLVLGAGFTRAVVPTAPLIRGDYGIPTLRNEFDSFPAAAQVLRDAQIDGRSDIDLELLLTRLMGMPYDSADAHHEFALVTTRLLRSVALKIAEAKASYVDEGCLKSFARAVSESGASIVTFNYDDLVDQALYQTHAPNDYSAQHWHPDGGYGFLCEPSFVTVATAPMFMNDCRSLLLKLHGSFNWRCRLGDAGPRSPNQILHRENWFVETLPIETPRAVLDRIEAHLEPEPLIVPPVLLKSDLTLHPVLRLVWSRARERLAEATRVIFLGYSLPTTDLAAKTLFRETIASRTDVEIDVVSIKDADANAMTARYKDLFRPLVPRFDLSGAADWVRRNCKAPTPAAGSA
jgi:hypothetical protein